MLLNAVLGSRCGRCGRRARLDRLGDVAPTHNGPLETRRFELVHCPRCDVVYLDPAPSPRDLRAIYEESTQFDDPHYTEPARVAQILDYYADAVRTLALLPEGGGRLLEIGAGLAWMARACKSLQPGIETVAQDVSSECAAACPWVDRYHVGPLDTLVDDAPFQLASMTHVIEHLVEPAAMLGAIASRLAVGGKLFVSAPYRPRGWRPGDGLAGWTDYSYHHVPAHVTYFSRTWFERESVRHGLAVAHWDASHEDGQAFALVLVRR